MYKCWLGGQWVAVKQWDKVERAKVQDMMNELKVVKAIQGQWIVQLLGACPDLACAVYVLMEGGTLED